MAFISLVVLRDKCSDFFRQQLAKAFLIFSVQFAFFFDGINKRIYPILTIFRCRAYGGRDIRYLRGTDLNGQILLCPHIIQNVSVVAVVQRPELVHAVGGILQFQRAAGHGQPRAILRGQGVAPGVVVRQRQGGRVVLGD